MKITHFAKLFSTSHSLDVANTKDPLSLRFTPELLKRIQNAADLLGIPKHTLCQNAIEAAVTAVEESKGLVLPIEFDVTRKPRKRAHKR